MPKSFPPTQSLIGAATPITGAAQAAGGTATGAGPLAVAAAISPIADIGSFALGISDALAADKGFSFNLCYFTFDLVKEGGQTGSPEPQNQVVVSEGPIFFKVMRGRPPEEESMMRGGGRGGSGSDSPAPSAVELGIRQIVNGRKLIGIVELRKLDGFDTAIGDNLAVEIVSQELLPSGVVLVVKGFINPAGNNYAHFVGAVLLQVTKSGNCTTKPLFIRQEPISEHGGAVGKAIKPRLGEGIELWTF
jgi:hypothetical protein